MGIANSQNLAHGPAVSPTLKVAELDAPGHGVRLRTTPERAVKGGHDATRVSASIVSTPILYPAGQAAAVLGTERNGELKGWVLLLMGAFLIATIFQRRYQALSDV